MPFLQASQRPHDVMQEMSTRAPRAKPDTAAPTSSTTPTPSWPRTRPSTTAGTSPARMWRSVPQMVVATIFTIASVGFWSVGFARSSNALFPGP